jgi:hypothetical protein
MSKAKHGLFPLSLKNDSGLSPLPGQPGYIANRVLAVLVVVRVGVTNVQPETFTAEGDNRTHCHLLGRRFEERVHEPSREHWSAGLHTGPEVLPAAGRCAHDADDAREEWDLKSRHATIELVACEMRLSLDPYRRLAPLLTVSRSLAFGASRRDGAGF